MFFPGTDASASGHADAAQVSVNPSQVTTRSCGTVNVKGVTGSVPNAGNPFLSTSRFCLNGHLISYGNTAITYANPPQSFVSAGRLLFAQTCSSCHGNEANGVGPDGQATIGPNLQGVGAATVDFWVSTGRMPATDVKAVEAERKPSRLTPVQALELAAWVNSLDPAVPAVPTPHLTGANQSVGADLFSLNCAACHTIEGAGDALAFGTNAPSLQNRSVTAQQVAEAIRTGPANMPRFSGNLTDRQVSRHRVLRHRPAAAPDESRWRGARRRRARWPRASSPCSSASAASPSSASGSGSVRERHGPPALAHAGADAGRRPERPAHG